MEKTTKTHKPRKSRAKSVISQKRKHEEFEALGEHIDVQIQDTKSEGTTHKVQSQESIEDRVSSIIIVTICLCFLAFVGYHSITSQNELNTEKTNTIPTVRSIAPSSQGVYDCEKHSGNHAACISAQIAGKGCSWFSDCQICITGSHEGKTYEDLCVK